MTRAVTQAVIRRAIRAAQGCDLTVTGFRIQADGTVEVTTAPPAPVADAPPGNLAAWRAQRDARRPQRPA